MIQGVPESFKEEEAARIIHDYNHGLPVNRKQAEDASESDAFISSLGPSGSEPLDAASCQWTVTATPSKEIDPTTIVRGTVHGIW
jgi:hypothetical protein